MSRHLKPNEWIYLFELYQNEYHKFVYEFELITQRKWENKNIRYIFRKKMQSYFSSYDIGVIMSKSGKTSKKGKGSGRPKKHRDRKTIIKEIIKELPDDLLNRIVEDWIDKAKENPNEKSNELLKEIIKTSSHSLRDIQMLINISKSHLSRIKNGWIKKSKIINVQKSNTEKLIIDIYFNLKGIRGRGPISAILQKKYGICLSERQVGRILARNGLKSIIRVKNSAKAKEDKNINVNIPDLVKRDYDNLLHNEHILASDVTYIQSPKDIHNKNHVFLSVIISHATKSVISYKLSEYNDTLLAIDTIKDINMKNVIFHTDHASIYTSNTFMVHLINKGWIQSMSSVGNSLDNREVEHFFGVFKTEFLSQVNSRTLTFAELEMKIDEWINYYNNERIQKKLGWLSPNSL